MEAIDDADTYFYIHTLAKQDGGRFGLLTPERIVVGPNPGSTAKRRLLTLSGSPATLKTPIRGVVPVAGRDFTIFG
jgi:hypothetical protein